LEKQKKKENINQRKVSSLLDNPDMETQRKDRPSLLIVRTLVISVLIALLVIGYVFKFSLNLYPAIGDYVWTAKADASNYTNANNGDVIVIKPYQNVGQIEIGDLVCFASSNMEGSGKVVSVRNDVVEINNNNEIVRMYFANIIGEQVNEIAFIGYIPAFIVSYVGIAVNSLLLLAYVAYITFKRIDYENTEIGKRLNTLYKQKREEENTRKNLLKQVQKFGGVDCFVGAVLEGDFDKNKAELIEFDRNTIGNIKHNYKYILKIVHETYMPKVELSFKERYNISSIAELMCESGEFDLDMEYMLVDLLLKDVLVEFDSYNFMMSAIEFIHNNKEVIDLLHFGSVFYILLTKNKKLRNSNMKTILDVYAKKAKSLTGEQSVQAQNIAIKLEKLLNK